jgi:hypothetical protein
MFKKYNPNPEAYRTDDCTIRALTKAFDVSWDDAYDALAEHGRELGDMMHKNWVWGDLLIEKGYSRYTLPNTCPRCYTVADFAKDHPVGTYILGTGEHVVAVVDGDWYDTWDSGDEVPIIYYWRNNNGI